MEPDDDEEEEEEEEDTPVIVDPTVAKLQCARFALLAEAHRASKLMSASEWLDAVRETAAGQTVGPRELRAIINIAWDF